jgi:pimeloyl-ACP methyl ester carboxylesterase
MATSIDAQDKTVTLNGLRFHYRDWGNEAAPPLVLLHGFTGHARSWDTTARTLRDRYHVLVLDQRGHGESEWATDYAPERMVEDIAAFREALGLERFALLGLSMGGRNAYGYAGLYPETVERLVIVDIGPDIPAAGSTRIRTGTLAGDRFATPEDAIRASRAANPRADETEQRHRVLNNLIETDDGQWTWRYDEALRSPDKPPLPRPDPERAWALLSRITCPTLLVRGALSDVLSPETAARMVQTIPNCRLVEVPDAGHSVPLENPRGFLAAISDFL